MSDYKIADGHDQQGSVAAVTYQPWSTNPDYRATRTRGADGSSYADGTASFEWIYDYLTESELATTDSEMGVSSGTPSNEVTTYTRKDDGDFGYFNATVERPPVKRDSDMLYHNVKYKFIDVEAVAAP